MSVTHHRTNPAFRRWRTAAPSRSALAAVLAMSVAMLLGPVAASASPAQRTTTGVMWHAQSGAGVVPGGSATLVATANGIAAHLQTRQLRPHHAYTVWLVVIDNPSACASDPCTPGDIFTAATDSQVTYAAGNVAGASGNGGFGLHMPVGPIDGWLPDRDFTNPLGAEVHLVVNDHGPALAEHLPGMIQTYRGGCSDNSPFPAIFPPTALADGEPGPNECRLYQTAVFQQ